MTREATSAEYQFAKLGAEAETGMRMRMAGYMAVHH